MEWEWYVNFGSFHSHLFFTVTSSFGDGREREASEKILFKSSDDNVFRYMVNLWDLGHEEASSSNDLIDASSLSFVVKQFTKLFSR